MLDWHGEDLAANDEQQEAQEEAWGKHILGNDVVPYDEPIDTFRQTTDRAWLPPSPASCCQEAVCNTHGTLGRGADIAGITTVNGRGCYSPTWAIGVEWSS